MASEVCAALGLTAGGDLSGELVAVAEERGGDAGFLIGSLTCDALKSGSSVCLLALRDGAAHHRHVAKKLGHDLRAAEEAGRAVVLEPFDKCVRPSADFAAIDMGVEDNLKRVFLEVKSALDSFPGQVKKCLVIDDVSELLTLGAPLSLVLAFLQYCRTLRLDHRVATVVGSSLWDGDEERRALAALLAHAARRTATVAGLGTGFSNVVTGSVQVTTTGSSLLPERKLFHYKATDRQVKVFAPGTVGIAAYN